MLQSLDEAGNLTHVCPHCQTAQSHHLGHEHIQWIGRPGKKPEHQLVSLPSCAACGAQTFLKVHFTEAELMAPNMWQEWNSKHEEQLLQLEAAHKAEQGGTLHTQGLAVQIQQLRLIKQAGGYHTGSHAVAQRHMELAKQLIASGKKPLNFKEDIDNAEHTTNDAH